MTGRDEFADLDPRIIFEGHRRLKGFQAIDIDDAIRLFGWRDDPDLVPAIVRERIMLTLKFLGYRETWAGPVGTDEVTLKWMRGPWRSDAEVLKRIPHRFVHEWD